jgi:hypothetical protein
MSDNESVVPVYITFCGILNRNDWFWHPKVLSAYRDERLTQFPQVTSE